MTTKKELVLKRLISYTSSLLFGFPHCFLFFPHFYIDIILHSLIKYV